jgi:hypothetical protein
MVGASLEELIATAIPVCREAQRLCPRTGPGRKPDYEDWVLAVLIMCGVLRRLKSKSAQYRFVRQHERGLCRLLGLDRLPARSTFFDRYPRVWPVVEAAIGLQGRLALREHVADAEVVAADKSLVAARGPEWNRKDRAAGRVPAGLRGLDREADWGVSGCREWVYGYSYEAVVTATRGSVVFPLLASAGPASANEHNTFPPKAARLPRSCRRVLADRGYDGDRQAQAVERTPARGRPTGRRFLCPLQRPPGRRPARGARAERRQRRLARAAYLRTRRGRALYRRRARTVEPFHGTLKAMFELGEHAWHRGLGNNRTQLLAAIFCYQLLVRFHWKYRRGRDAQVQYLLDGL